METSDTDVAFRGHTGVTEVSTVSNRVVCSLVSNSVDEDGSLLHRR